ncbi:MAG: adenylyltransferase/cytidyltransferase family protein [Candidatus Kerfeldbacteria bacterium]
MKKVLITGTFDHIHPGHIDFLKQAKKLGDFLIVVIARDKTVTKIKDKTPLKNEYQRQDEIKKLKIADRVILGKIGDKFEVIELQKPDIICLGYDQKSFTKGLRVELKKRGLKPKIVRLKSFKPNLYKSSIIKKALKKT